MVRNLDTFISKETIKPSSSTTPHLKTYNLSYSDNFNPPVHIPLVFFYPYNGSSCSTIISHQEKTAQLLKMSLSQTLTQYYPFAGKLVPATDGSYVDCNDEGVDFVEARVNAHLSKIDYHKCQSLDHFFPIGPGANYQSLMKVKLTYFDCGGLALGVSLSHKIGDTCTLYAFIKYWAAVNYAHYNPGLNEQAPKPLPPHLIISPREFATPGVILDYGINNCVSKRFIFPNSKLYDIKTMMRDKNPTRVEVVSSLVYLCAVRAAKANNASFIKPFAFAMGANLRPRLTNPFPETVVGNFSWTIITENSIDELTLNSVIDQIKKGKAKLNGVTISQLKFWQKVSLGNYNKSSESKYSKFYNCTSLCGYPVYEVDFGWGNPVRVAFPGAENFFVLMETPNGDGIEVLVTLEEEDMAKFQVDEQFLEFAFAA